MLIVDNCNRLTEVHFLDQHRSELVCAQWLPLLLPSFWSGELRNIRASRVHGNQRQGMGKRQRSRRITMEAGDKACRISFPGFIDEVRKIHTPATEVTVTRQPRSREGFGRCRQGTYLYSDCWFQGNRQVLHEEYLYKCEGRVALWMYFSHDSLVS